MINLNDKEEGGVLAAILAAALDQFSQHGFEKTGMSDIATAASVSRTTLYKQFSTKEDVFRALSQRINAGVLDAVKNAARAPGEPQDRLAGVIHARVQWVYELLHLSPYGRELINEKNRLCGGVAIDANDRFLDLVSQLIGGLPRGRSAMPARKAARLLIASINGVIGDAATRAEAEKGVSDIVQIFARGLSD
jgi:AcrR family transcriptional regulator